MGVIVPVTGQIPASDKKVEIDLSQYGMFSGSRSAVWLMKVKLWTDGGAGGYDFQPAIFNADVADGVFMGDAHLDSEPSLQWGSQAADAVANNKVFVGANQQNQFEPILTSDDGRLWLFPAKGTAGETVHYEIHLLYSS